MKTITGNSHRATPMVTPRQLTIEMPPSQQSTETVLHGRDEVRNILNGRDDRLLVVVGPCSIHDPKAALEYAHKLKDLSLCLQKKMAIVMRVYLEKPRTITGWKGLINDPDLDGSCDMARGMRLSRDLLLKITEMGLAAATEILDPLISYYLGDPISWASIGARTSESQVHRQIASGLSMPVGFKNGTCGSLAPALHAILAAHKSHTFLGTDREGRVSVISTGGNPDGHLVLRGGKTGPNYNSENCRQASEQMARAGLNEGLLIDCNHENSSKQYNKQIDIAKEIVQRRIGGENNIRGIMLESNLRDGSQTLCPGGPAAYGVSITDPCLGWDRTEELLRSISSKL